MSFVPNAVNLERHGPALRPQRLGVRRASTFTGFCSKHDDAVFAPLEKQPFTGAPEQCFLLAYRALARELHLKQATLRYWDARCATQPLLEDPSPTARFLKGFLRGTRQGATDLASHKREYDEALLGADYSRLRAHVMELSDPASVMCSGGIIPEHTFTGERLLDLMRHPGRASLLSVSAFADATLGFVVFAWLKDHTKYCERLVGSLSTLSDSSLTSSLIRFFFECCENLHMQPSWWRGLSPAARERLIAHMNPSSEFKSRDLARDFFTNDGIDYGNWHLERRYDVGYSRR